jgi:hypothetical protein
VIERSAASHISQSARIRVKDCLFFGSYSPQPLDRYDYHIIAHGEAPLIRISLRRLLVLQVLLLWQGGFLFYTAVVVPVGTTVLGSAAAQGAITAHVTDTLNLIGVLTLLILAAELGLTHDPSVRRTTARWWCWWILFVAQGLLLYFHRLLDAFMDPSRTHVVIRPPFYPVHRLYLWASTAQWLVCLVLVWLTLLAWHAEDREIGRG